MASKPEQRALAFKLTKQDYDAGSATIGLCNPKSPSNVGAVMRAAGCYGAAAVYYSGQRFAKAAKYHQDTFKMSEQIPLAACEDILATLAPKQKLVCVELAEGATALPEFEHPQDALYVFGPEDGNIQQRLLDQAHAVVYVPTIGCMNLAATVNVLLYDRLAKQELKLNHDALIQYSRDINNRLKVPNSSARPSAAAEFDESSGDQQV